MRGTLHFACDRVIPMPLSGRRDGFRGLTWLPNEMAMQGNLFLVEMIRSTGALLHFRGNVLARQTPDYLVQINEKA